jgi:YidC/Oxa1 family membrane protein insertase
METKRYITAIGLSMLVLVVYLRFFAPQPPHAPAGQQPAQQEQAVTKEQPKETAPAPASRTVTKSIAPAAKGRDIVIETDHVRAVVNTAGGVITAWELKDFREADKEDVGIRPFLHRIFSGEKRIETPKKPLGNVQLFTRYEGVKPGEVIAPLTLTPDDQALANVSAVEFRADADAITLDKEKPTRTLTLTYTGPGGIAVEKKLTFHNDSYAVDIAITTKGFNGYTLALGTDFGMSDKVSSNAAGRVGFAALVNGKLELEKIGSVKNDEQRTGDVTWFGQEDKYFTATLIAGGNGTVTETKTPAPKEIGDLLNSEIAVRDKTGSRTYTLYAGPKKLELLRSFGKGLDRMVDYGWFGVLARPMFWLMVQFYKITRNYGIAIILLTLVVRGLLFYPSLKSAKAMEEMKSLQPQMAALREKYKKDPQKLNAEMMRLYKEHKVNPLGGCLPMVLQLPFFVALYNVLSVSIELRQSPFLSFWIKDLSVYDPYYILPILMGVSMVATMKMTSTSVDPQQQKMMMFMNIAFIFLFAWLPAGLLLYITLSNVLSMVQQLYVRRLLAA